MAKGVTGSSLNSRNPECRILIYRQYYEARRAHTVTGYFSDLQGKVASDLGSGGSFYPVAALGQRATDV